MNFLVNSKSRTLKFDNFARFQNVISNNPFSCERHYDALHKKIDMWLSPKRKISVDFSSSSYIFLVIKIAFRVWIELKEVWMLWWTYALREKCPYSEFFWSVFSPNAGNTIQKNSEYGHFSRSDGFHILTFSCIMLRNDQTCARCSKYVRLFFNIMHGKVPPVRIFPILQLFLLNVFN